MERVGPAHEHHRRPADRRGPRGRGRARARARAARVRARADEPDGARARRPRPRPASPTRSSTTTCASGTTATSKGSRPPRSAARGGAFARLDDLARARCRAARRSTRSRRGPAACSTASRPPPATCCASATGTPRGCSPRWRSSSTRTPAPGFALDPATISVVGSEHGERARLRLRRCRSARASIGGRA